MSSNTAQLRESKVIPDVLSVNPNGSLTITWPGSPGAFLDSPGKELDREATQPEPTITLGSAVDDDGSNYVLIMTDPDLMAHNDQKFGQVRHWLAANLSIDGNGSVNFSSADNVSPYIGPAPLANYITPRPHRYVFILARPEGSEKVTVSNKDFQVLQKDYPAAFEGKQDLQDLKDRWGFNAQKFMDNKGLKPVAVTYMLVGGTLKSTVDNMAMTGQAVVDKISGR